MDSGLKEIIYSQILGDGHFGYKDTLRITHSIKQKDYLVYKKELFESHGLKAVLHNPYITKTTFTDSTELMGCAIKIPGLKTMDFGLVKMVNELGTLGLLLWWCDDGTFCVHHKKNSKSVSRFGYLCTERFSDEEQILVVNLLKDQYGLELGIHSYVGGHTKKSYSRIYFSATSMRRMIDLLRPHIVNLPKSMLYKFNMKYKETSHLPKGLVFSDYNFYTDLKCE